MVYYLKVCFPALWNVEGFEVVKRSSKIRTVDSDETKLQTLGKTSLLNDSLFCCVINIASLKDRKEAPWVEGGGVVSAKSRFLDPVVLSSCSMNQWSFFEMLHAETRRSHLYAQSTILTNFVQMKKLPFSESGLDFFPKCLCTAPNTPPFVLSPAHFCRRAQ